MIKQPKTATARTKPVLTGLPKSNALELSRLTMPINAHRYIAYITCCHVCFVHKILMEKLPNSHTAPIGVRTSSFFVFLPLLASAEIVLKSVLFRHIAIYQTFRQTMSCITFVYSALQCFNNNNIIDWLVAQCLLRTRYKQGSNYF